jgi:hypothetical protein
MRHGNRVWRPLKLPRNAVAEFRYLISASVHRSNRTISELNIKYRTIIIRQTSVLQL